MINRILLLTFTVLSISFISCTASYKNAQTPDDVYYSPVRNVNEENDEDNMNRSIAETAEERNIRMKIRDRRWRDMDERFDNDCACRPYSVGYSFYNPRYWYAMPAFDAGIRQPKSAVRTTNFSAYGHVSESIKNPKTGEVQTRTYNTTNNREYGPGRRIFSGGEGDSRIYTPSSSGGSSGGSSRPIFRPSR